MARSKKKKKVRKEKARRVAKERKKPSEVFWSDTLSAKELKEWKQNNEGCSI